MTVVVLLLDRRCLLRRGGSNHLVLKMRCLILHYPPDLVSKLTAATDEVFLQEAHLVLLQLEYLVICVLLSSLYHLFDVVLVFRHFLHHLLLCRHCLALLLHDAIDLVLEPCLALTQLIDFVNDQLKFLV